jgi:hypothetical protein
VTYDELNELVHVVSDKIDAATGVDVDRYAVNDLLSGFLQGLGIQFEEE